MFWLLRIEPKFFFFFIIFCRGAKDFFLAFKLEWIWAAIAVWEPWAIERVYESILEYELGYFFVPLECEVAKVLWRKSRKEVWKRHYRQETCKGWKRFQAWDWAHLLILLFLRLVCFFFLLPPSIFVSYQDRDHRNSTMWGSSLLHAIIKKQGVNGSAHGVMFFFGL